MKRFFLLLTLLPFFTLAQTPSLTLTPVITGLSRPVFVTHCGDNRLFVVEQAGRIKVYDSVYNYKGIFLNVSNIVSQPSTQGDERGLLGLAFHPNYLQNGYFYINYTRTVSGQLKTFIARYSVFSNNPNKADSLSAVEILSFNQPFSNHNGGCLKFGPDGYLYIGTGDGGSANDPQGNGQKLNTYLGKMLRIDVDAGSPYAVPTDNPFVGVPNVFPEIWAYGIRNPWRFSFDKLNGNLWIADVGQNLYEEVNVHYYGDTAGDNYGWRCFEGMHSTGLSSGVTGQSCPNYDDTHKPVYEYTHTGGECSVTGGYVYRGALYNALFGNYLCADYCSGKIRRLIDNGDGTFTPEILFTSTTVVSFGEDRWGELYVCSITQNIVYKISVNNICQPVAYITNGDTAAICPGQTTFLSALNNPALSYQWYFNGNSISSNGAKLAVSEPGTYYVVVTNANGCSTASENIVVVNKPLPNVTFETVNHLCVNDEPITLTGSPANGAFSGTGVNDNIFNPAIGAGSYEISYSYSEPGGCTNIATQTIVVYALPQLSFVGLPDTVCGDILEVQIPLQANPPGGVFSGSTVNGNTLTLNAFNTSFEVTYTYTDANGCTNSITSSVFNALCTSTLEKPKEHIAIYPNPANSIITVNGIKDPATMELYSLSGELILSEVMLQQNTIGLSHLTNGLYYYRIITPNSVYTGKIEVLK